jgi:hypothetical protein
MYSNWVCSYTKTFNGSCDQPKARGESMCYYHLKVEQGLIETDEENVMRDMPSIVL